MRASVTPGRTCKSFHEQTEIGDTSRYPISPFWMKAFHQRDVNDMRNVINIFIVFWHACDCWCPNTVKNSGFFDRVTIKFRYIYEPVLVCSVFISVCACNATFIHKLSFVETSRRKVIREKSAKLVDEYWVNVYVYIYIRICYWSIFLRVVHKCQ